MAMYMYACMCVCMYIGMYVRASAHLSAYAWVLTSVCIRSKLIAVLQTNQLSLFSLFLLPCSGWVKDKTDSYNPIFYLALAQSVLAVATVVVVTCCGSKSRAS